MRFAAGLLEARLLVVTIFALVLAGCAGTPDHEGAGFDGAGHPIGKRADLIKAGLSQLGSPYVFGGESPVDGFDCSGLTFYAHQRVGLAIPRMALEQRRASTPVSRRHPRPGDMVFFKTGRNVYHVGLMIDEERFVHASTSRRRVRVSRLDTPYWQEHYLGAGTFLH